MFPGSNKSGSGQTSSTNWTEEEDKLFENAIAVVPEDSPNRWEKIAEQVPGKSPEEIKERYDALSYIESCLVKLLNYADDVAAAPEEVCDSASVNQSSSVSRPMSSKNLGRRPSTRWTEEEHMKFLMGLKEYGKGHWKSISENCVVTRTPVQIASHAYKYFLRQNSTNNNEKRRPSILDITTVDTKVVPPITGKGGDFLPLNPANNERTVAAPANDQGSSSEVSTAATTGDETVESSPYNSPDQKGGNGHGN